MHSAHFEYLMQSNPTLTVWWKPLFEHFHPHRWQQVRDARIYSRPSFVWHPACFISSGDCTVSYDHFNMKCSPVMCAENLWKLKGTGGASSFSYANTRAQHRPPRVWGPSRRLRSPPCCFNDYWGGFLTMLICSCHISTFEIPVWEGKMRVCWIVPSGSLKQASDKQTAHFFTMREAVDIDLSQGRRLFIAYTKQIQLFLQSTV